MKTLTFTEQLRKFVEDSGQSRYLICKATGLDEGNMSRFMRLGVGLNTRSIDLLCAHFGLRLVATKGPKKQRANTTRTKGE